MKYFIFVAAFLPLIAYAEFETLTRTIPESELPGKYSPAVGRPTVDRMRIGSVEFTQAEPWAMPRMAYKTGMLASRPLDEKFMALESLEEKYRYFLAQDLRAIVAMEDTAQRRRLISRLSPAEKYDLVVGDLDGNFAHSIWQEVRRQFSKGDVPSWFGLCDGSSAASILFDEPQRAVRVASRLPGIDVEFSIGDTKALLAYMMTTYVARDLPIFGRRCYIEKPDPARSECLGLNPGSLHQILLEMTIDPERFPYMIVDRSPNSAVWNSALLSASFSYYRPETGQAVSYNAADHLVDVNAYGPPPGSPGWAPGTRYLLFAVSTLRMADTRTAVAHTEQGKMNFIDLTVRYVLEINSRLEVIGGEWLTSEHPGFIWALSRNYRPKSLGDLETSGMRWEGANIPEDAMPAVLRSSQAGQPLFRIIDMIHRQAK